ncbi:MAG: ABC transporter permease [Proteobacteria bacterium]|nr:ABC transporter permease [Pseudomonadota bacterium]
MNSKVQHYIDLVAILTEKEIKVRYKSSFFGYLWSVAHPLAFALVFFVAFKVVVKIQVEDYALFLIAGLFPWQWFANSVNAAPRIFLGNASIIKKVNFPRNIIPFTQVFQDMIHFILAIPVVVLFLFLYHKLPSFSWLYGIPVLLIIQFLMTYGICLMISSTNLFFRDLERLTIIFTTMLFYFTPVIYPEKMVPVKYKPLINLNPLAPLMISWRELFLNGTLSPLYLAVSFGYAILAFILGFLIYRKLSWKFAEVL